MSTVLDTPTVAVRRAVEALRSGVPSADAIEVLGSAQPEARFDALCERIEATGSGHRPVGGLLLGGGSGTGKSHLLGHLWPSGR